jgi:Delta24(24(1))-sterol reductase
MYCRYSCFITSQALFSAYLPGIAVRGLPLPSGQRLVYNCNGLAAWWLTLAAAAALHISGVMPLSYPVNMAGPLMTVAVIAGNLFSAMTHASAYIFAKVCI